VTGVNSSKPGRRGVVRRIGLSFWHGFKCFYDSEDLTYASSIAYYGLLSLFPVLLVGFAILGSVTKDAGHRNAVLGFILQYFPSQFDFISLQLDEFRNNSAGLGVVGTIALVWGALGVFGAISTAVNYAWRVEVRRGFWKHKLVSFLMFGVAELVLLIALLLVSASELAGARWFAVVVARFPGLLALRSLTVRNATTLLFILVVALVYYFVPNTKVRFRDVWPGAIVTGLLWKGVLVAFSWYVRDMSRFTRVNGSIAVVVVFLVWVYTQAVILLYGVEFTAAYARLGRQAAEEPVDVPRPQPITTEMSET